MSETKKCSKCLEIKSLNEFNKNKSKKFGVASVCKICHSNYRKEHYIKNKTKVIEQVNEYRVKNPDKVTKYTMNAFSKKAGRTIPVNCAKCDNIVYQNSFDYFNNKKSYCSLECKKIDCKSDYHHYLLQVKKRAIKNKKEFDLDEQFIKDLLENKQKNKCNVSNIDIKIYPLKSDKSLSNTASLDRIDSNKGYTKDNVQWVCLGINYMKLDFSDMELHKLLKLIKENYI
jgi:endogenous inhibitor of DNA gyrase (YacG/DUF329 family)